MKLLRKSRPKWSDRDVYAAGAKLEAINIVEVQELLRAAEKELKGQQGGVNQRLQEQGLRCFADTTLRALLKVQAKGSWHQNLIVNLVSKPLTIVG